MPTPTVATLSAELQAHARPVGDLARFQRYMGTTRPALGVRTDDLRRVAHAAARALPPAVEGDALWLALLDGLYAGPTFDQILLAGHLLHARPAARKRLELERLRTWLRPLQGWCEVDTTCQNQWSAAEVLARWDEWDPFLASLAQEESRTLRRAALVLPLQSLRDSADPRLAARAFANLRALQRERDPLITKAVSWLLRALLTHHPEDVAAWLAAHAADLPAIALRETRNKLATGKK